MTLVVTEVSELFGCVVVGDSAVTMIGPQGTTVVYGAEKVHFSSTANIGFALWGNACLAGQRVDALVSSFVAGLGSSANPRSAGQDLAELLAREGRADGRSWRELRGGVHVCGYDGSIPVLFHVHTGAVLPAPQGPFQLYEDFPDGRVGCQLRNGYFQMFAGLFDAMQQYAEQLGQLGFRWPNERLEDRLSYYTIMVETIARTLEAAGHVPAVGGLVSSVAFNRHGLQVDKRVPRGNADFCSSAPILASFDELPSNSPHAP